jgi:hypothetical protein
MSLSIAVQQILGRTLPLAVVLASLSSLWAIPAQAAGPTGWGGGSCIEVTAFPANIVGPGVYCLSFKYINFPLASGALIKISADDVVFDLNGATLDGTPTANGAYSFGVLAENHKNITVRNGTIKGFNYAISLIHTLAAERSDPRPSHGLVVENIRAINSRNAGIRVIGHDSEIRGNYVTNTGGSSDPTVAATTWGIYAYGQGLRILDNDVTHTLVNGSSGGTTYGIYLAGITHEVTIVNNRVTQAAFGIYGDPTVSWGKYRDNITVNVGVPYTGGTDIGNNH